jgi:hypothetical protein
MPQRRPWPALSSTTEPPAQRTARDPIPGRGPFRTVARVTALEDAPVIVRDLFPALLRVPPAGRVERAARVVVTRTRAYVWTWGAGAADLVFTGRLVVGHPITFGLAPNVPVTKPLRVAVIPDQVDQDPAGEPAGEVVLDVTWASGCGCGNPLRSWEPWSPMVVGALA